MTLTLDPARPAGQRVVAVEVGGAPLDPERRYRVAVADYVANGGDGITAFRDGQMLVDAESGPLAAEILLQAVTAAGHHRPRGRRAHSHPAAAMTWRWSLVLAGVLLGAAGCGRYEEIARMPSPDGLIEAVVVEVETGAGNPYVYQVHLVTRGGAWQKGRERLVYSDPVRFRVTWADPRHLELCFDDAQIQPSPQRPDAEARSAARRTSWTSGSSSRRPIARRRPRGPRPRAPGS